MVGQNLVVALACGRAMTAQEENYSGPWWIIDGYSLMHKDPRLLPETAGSLETARLKLIRLVEEHATANVHITIVFDGTSGHLAHPPDSDRLEILFSPAHHSADTIIERLVYDDPRPERITVITSDRAELDTVTARGARGQSCRQFIEETQTAQQARRASGRRLSRRVPANRLGEHFPD